MNSGYTNEAIGKIFSFTTKPSAELPDTMPYAPTELAVSPVTGRTD